MAPAQGAQFAAAMAVYEQKKAAWDQQMALYEQWQAHQNGGAAGAICTPYNLLFAPFHPRGAFGPPQPIKFPVAGGQNLGWKKITIKAGKFTYGEDEKKEKKDWELKGTFEVIYGPGGT